MVTNKPILRRIPEHSWKWIFLNICYTAFNETAPLKEKHAKANSSPFMNETILKVIMKQARLRNNFLKHRYKVNKRASNAQISAFP